jgi:hypothetical protein
LECRWGEHSRCRRHSPFAASTPARRPAPGTPGQPTFLYCHPLDVVVALETGSCAAGASEELRVPGSSSWSRPRMARHAAVEAYIEAVPIVRLSLDRLQSRRSLCAGARPDVPPGARSAPSIPPLGAAPLKPCSSDLARGCCRRMPSVRSSPRTARFSNSDRPRRPPVFPDDNEGRCQSPLAWSRRGDRSSTRRTLVTSRGRWGGSASTRSDLGPTVNGS